VCHVYAQKTRAGMASATLQPSHTLALAHPNMKKTDPNHSFYALNSLWHKYKCIKCGAYIEKGELSCYRCGHVFSASDVESMKGFYQKNKAENWHHLIYFVLFMLVFLGLIILVNL